MNQKLKNNPICVPTFDIEEWFQVENLRAAMPREDWPLRKSTVARNTGRILTILERHQITGTFFVLGWVAERNPELLKEIARQGHEVACHGFGHDLTYNLDDQALLADIQGAKAMLEQVISKPVTGYRAPNFSVDDRLLDSLRKSGFQYDSSFNPFSLNSRYGSIGQSLTPVSAGCFRAENGIYEMPIATLPVSNAHIPIGGGAYFRILPLPLFKQLVLRKLKQDGYYNFYLHPWELEPEQVRIKTIKLNYRFRHYYGLKNTAKKLDKFIEAMKIRGCRFMSMEGYLQTALQRGTTNSPPTSAL